VFNDCSEIASFRIFLIGKFAEIAKSVIFELSNRGLEPLYAAIIIVIRAPFIYALTIFGGEHGNNFL